MSGPFHAGSLNQRVVHERAVDNPDGAGGFVRSWQALGSVWVRVEPASARRGVRAEQTAQFGAFNITARQQADITPGDRLLWRGRVLSVLTVMPVDETARFSRLFCEETV